MRHRDGHSARDAYYHVSAGLFFAALFDLRAAAIEAEY